jgi:hypothetical protein
MRDEYFDLNGIRVILNRTRNIDDITFYKGIRGVIYSSYLTHGILTHHRISWDGYDIGFSSWFDVEDVDIINYEDTLKKIRPKDIYG